MQKYICSRKKRKIKTDSNFVHLNAKHDIDEIESANYLCSGTYALHIIVFCASFSSKISIFAQAAIFRQPHEYKTLELSKKRQLYCKTAYILIKK